MIAGQASQEIADGHVAVPITLRSSGIGAAVHVGDHIDIVMATESGYPEVIARDARVIDIPGAGGFTSSPIIVVSVPQAQGASLAAETSPDLSFVVVKR